MAQKNLIPMFLVTAVLLMSALIVKPAQAENVPGLIGNCWIESGADLVDGEFAVHLDTKTISKSKLIAILNALSGVNIEPKGYPLIFGPEMFVYVRGVDHTTPQMDRGTFIKTVHAELEAIAALSRGVSASCNYNSYPAPAVGVRN